MDCTSRRWRQRNLPSTKLVLAQAIRKQNYATPDSILIDDRENNINQWIASGGIGILHTSASDTIKQLKKKNDFIFEITIPIAIGTVGGLTSLHPLVKWSLELLGNPSSSELMQIIVAVGLSQNFGALKSLITSGIQMGHMKES